MDLPPGAIARGQASDPLSQKRMTMREVAIPLAYRDRHKAHSAGSLVRLRRSDPAGPIRLSILTTNGTSKNRRRGGACRILKTAGRAYLFLPVMLLTASLAACSYCFYHQPFDASRPLQSPWHLLAREFCGPGDLRNIVAMTKAANQTGVGMRWIEIAVSQDMAEGTADVQGHSGLRGKSCLSAPPDAVVVEADEIWPNSRERKHHKRVINT